MLTEVKNTLKYIFASLKCNIKAALEYKKSFIIQTVFMIVNNLFFLIYWIVVFSINDGDLNGLVMKDILLLWTLPNGAWGIANFFFGGLRDIDKLIITGGLDSYLLQPKNLIVSIATSRCNFGSCGDLLYGLVLGIIVSESVAEYLIILFFMIIGAIIFMSCFTIVRSLAVWFGDMENIARVYEQSLLITLSTYPYNIFGNVMKVLMFTIVPTAYISHLPIKIITQFDIKLVVLVISFAMIIAIIAIKLFNYILKKYESGNNISMKG